MQQAIEVIQIVEAIQRAKKRIPEKYSGSTFFSGYDLWEYHTVLDERTCVICEGRAELDIVIGSVIRLLYPDLEILDEDTIMVNEHPNCRCYLQRTWFEELTGEE